MQEAVRKDVERAFGLLQARLTIVCGPARMWHIEHSNSIMATCILLHNMIVEDQSDKDDQVLAGVEYRANVQNLPVKEMCGFGEYINRFCAVQNDSTHNSLRGDLVKHLWQWEGEM